MPSAGSLSPPPSPQPPSLRWQLPQGLAAFRHRDYRILWSAQAVSLTGIWMQALAQSWLVLTLTESPLHLALINVCQFGPALLFGLPAGLIADRYSKRGLMLATQATSGVLTALLAIVVVFGWVQLWHIYATVLALGIVSALANPVRQAYVVDVVGKADLVNAVALNSALFNATRVIGPAVAGVIVAQVGIAICFAVNAVAYLPVVIGLMLIRARGNPEKGSDEGSAWLRLQQGLRYVTQTPEVLRPVLMVGAIAIFGMNFSVWMPLLAVELNTGAEGFGWLMSALGVGSLAGSLAVAFLSRRLGTRSLLVTPVAFAVFEIGMALLAGLRAHAFLVLPVATAAGLAMSMTLSMTNATIQSLVPNALRGRVSSIYMTVFMGSVPLGALVAGMTSSLLGVPGSIAVGGSIVLLVALVAAVSGLARSRKPAVLQQPSPVPARSGSLSARANPRGDA